MKHLGKLLLIIIGLPLLACTNDSPKPKITIESFTELLEVVADADPNDRQGIVDDYIETVTQTPVIESSTEVYFLYTGNTSSVAVAGDFNGWNPSGAFTNLANTNLWYKKLTFEVNARLDYKLVLGGSNWILDPRNPNQVSGGFGPNSELAMPDYEQPWEIKVNPEIPKGAIENQTIASTQTGKTYSLKIYLPPNYNSEVDYPVAYFQDGGEYYSLASATVVIDNLIHQKKIDPVIAVFVTPTNRNIEYAGGDRMKYSDFFVLELVPYIDTNYSTIDDKNARAVIGDSYGGNISAIISFSNPTIFGNCGLHSGAFQSNNYEANDIVMDGTNHGIKVASIWGTYEGLYTNMRTVRDYLIEKGYEVSWKELPEGHSWGLWRATIDDMLIFFFPKSG